MRGNFACNLVLAGFLLAAGSALAAPSLLESPKPDPCTDSPDYVPGIDADGRPVARADEGARPVPLPGQILVPLPQRGPPGTPQRGGARRAAGRVAIPPMLSWMASGWTRW